MMRRSLHMYDVLLKFYPKKYRQEFGEEMKFVFAESLKDAYTENGDKGIVALWGRTLVDISKNLFIQHADQKGGRFMATKSKDIIMQNKVFSWIVLATGAILLIPLIAMQFTNEVDWDAADFIIIGILLFGMGSLFVLTARKIQKKHRLIAGVIFILAILYIWAELAVGIFTNLGS